MKNIVRVFIPMLLLLLLMVACTPEVATYTISFDPNGGSLISSSKVKDGLLLAEPEEPTRVGYTFSGWYINDTLLTEYDFDAKVSGNLTLYAKWTPVTTTVTFDLGYEGATPISPQELIYPALCEEPALPVREFYAFTGWQINGADYDFTAPVPADITLTATWSNDYIFTVNNDLVTLSGYQSSVTPVELTMPNTINGMNVVSLGEGLFQAVTTLETVTLPNGLVSLGADVFNGCTSLTTIILPDTVENIGARAFKNCTSLAIVILSESLEIINANAFENCNVLLAILIPDSVITIGNNAFLNCAAISTVIIGSSVETIGESAFYNCSSLLNINIPASVTIINTRAFARCLSLVNVTIGNGVTTIGSYAFDNCNNMEYLTLGNSITSIGSYAFLNCSDIESLIIPDSVVTIGAYAFSGCNGLSSMTVGEGVSSINNMAFANCTSLNNIIMSPMAAPLLGNNVFQNIPNTHSILIRTGATGYNEGFWLNLNVGAYYVVSFDIEFYPNPASQNVMYQNKATAPTAPTRSGYYFTGWYTNSARTIQFDFNTEITANRTLYGGWAELFSTQTVDNTITITGYANNSFANLTIPASLNGLPVTAIAASAFSNNAVITHIILPDTITSIGESAFSNCTNLVSLKLSSALTAIEANTFYNCNKLTSLTVPNTVTAIGDNAFKNCTLLDTITMSNALLSIGDMAFMNCTHIESFALPITLTSLGISAFENCSNLLSVAIPSTVDTIKANTFKNCELLATVTLNSGLLTIENDAFNGCIDLVNISLPSTLTSIGSYAFNNCQSLANITIPQDVVEIEAFTFHNCISLVTVSNIATLTSIGDYAFYNTSIGTINLGDSLVTIGQHAFNYCILLNGITLPDTLTSIGVSAFMNCASLTSINIPTAITVINTNTFMGCNNLNTVQFEGDLLTISEGAFRSCINLPELILPDTVTTIGNNAFRECVDLVSIEISEVLSSLGNYVFYNCVSLTSIVLPDTLKVIENNTFDGCVALSSVILGKLVSNIKTLAFNNCSSLESIDIPATITNIGVSAFSGNSALKEVIIRSINAPTVGTFLEPVVFDLHPDHKIYRPYGSSGYTNIHNTLNVWGNYWSTYTINVFYYAVFAYNYYDCPDNVAYTVFDGNMFLEPEAPSFHGGTFVKWSYHEYDPDDVFNVDFENDTINDHTVIYAQWDYNIYEIIFNPNGGEGTPPTQAIIYGEYLDYPDDPILYGMMLSGWYLDPECTLEFDINNDVVINDMTLYAGWEVALYLVQFISGGVIVGTQEIRHNDYAQYDTYGVADTDTQIFLGWNYEDSLFDFNNTPVTDYMTLFSMWEPRMYTVTYDLNYPEGINFDIDYSYNQIASYQEPIREDYILEGWYYDSDCLTAYDFDNDGITEDTTLYAKWVQGYIITFYVEEGEPIDRIIVLLGDTVPALPTPVMDDETLVFSHWCDADTFDEVQEGDLLTSNITVIPAFLL